MHVFEHEHEHRAGTLYPFQSLHEAGPNGHRVRLALGQGCPRPGLAGSGGQVSYHLAYQRKGQLSLAFLGAYPAHGDLASLEVQKARQQRRLTDTGLALDQYNPRRTRKCVPQGQLQLCQLGPAPDKAAPLLLGRPRMGRAGQCALGALDNGRGRLEGVRRPVFHWLNASATSEGAVRAPPAPGQRHRARHRPPGRAGGALRCLWDDVDVPQAALSPTPVRVFESYGRADAAKLAAQLRRDLEEHSYQVWQDVAELHGGALWDEKIREAMHNSDLVVAILSPHSTRTGVGAGDDHDSVCLDEIALARFGDPPRPIVPVMAIDCEPPLTIYRLHCIDMREWERSDAHYRQALEELLKAIDLARTGHPRLRRSTLSLNAGEQLAAVLESRRKNFVGRDWLFEEVERWRDTTSERALLVTGEPGAGKSAFVAELVHRSPGGQVVAYHCCTSELPDSLSAGEFVRNIAAMLASQLPAYAEAIEQGEELERLLDAEQDPAGAFQKGIMALLARLPVPPGPPRYILVDGIDEALAGQTGHAPVTIVDLLSTSTAQFPSWLRLVLTSRRDRKVTERFADARELELDEQDQRNLDDVRAYLGERLASAELQAMVAGTTSAQAELLDRLCQLSDGSFVYAKHVIDALSRGKLTVQELEHQPPGLARLYETSFARTFTRPEDFEASVATLAVLMASRRSLLRPELQQVLGLSAIELEQQLAPLQPFLDQVEGAFSLFHNSLAEWLSDPSTGTTRFHVQPQQGEPALRQWCARWQQLDDDYPLRYYPQHLAAVGATDELLGLLANPEFQRRRAAAGLGSGTEVTDNAAAASLLLAQGRTKDLVKLARTANPYRRDGIALALRQAGPSREQAVRATLAALARGPRWRPSRAGSARLNGQMVAIDTASERGYADVLVGAALSRSEAVRALVVPKLYRFWAERAEEGWALLEALGTRLPGRLGAPRRRVVEVSGGLSLAIMSRHLDDREVVSRLGDFWQRTVHRALSAPVVRLAGRSIVSRAGIGALSIVMRDQPEYQPVNLNELRHSFATGANRSRALSALSALEDPALGLSPAVEALGGADEGFDLFLMMVAERALVLHGARDPGGLMTTVGDIFNRGPAWFRQSCLYCAFQALYTAREPQAAWLDLYQALTKEFVSSNNATLGTAVGTYTFPTHLAWAEVIFAKYRPQGKSQFLAEFFEGAWERQDLSLCATVLRATDLLSTVYRQQQVSLDALRRVATLVPNGAPLEQIMVDSLANIRLFEGASVNRFLAKLGNEDLTSRVMAAAPSIRANEFPTWLDGFVNRQLVASEEFRLEVCGAFRRAAAAGNLRQLLYESVTWVLHLLGE